MVNLSSSREETGWGLEVLYFLKRHPMKDGRLMVWQMMDLKIRMYGDTEARGGRQESQAVDGNNEKGPRNL